MNKKGLRDTDILDIIKWGAILGLIYIILKGILSAT